MPNHIQNRIKLIGNKEDVQEILSHINDKDKIMKQEIIDTVKKLAGHEFLYLDTAIQVKKTPHSIPVNVWAISVSPKDKIFLMDSNEQWFELQDSDINYLLILPTLYQRVKTIYKKYQAA